MKKDEKRISKEVLERIDKTDNQWDSGNKVLDITIEYKKEAYRTRPRGYYLCFSVYLETDRGFTQHCLSFGDEGDPSEQVLLKETKAFSQKTFDALVADPEMVRVHTEKMKAEYIRRRDLKKARYAKTHEAEEDSVNRGEMAGLLAGGSIV